MRRVYLFPFIFLVFFMSTSYGSVLSQKWTSCIEISQGMRSIRYPAIQTFGEKLVVVWADDRLGEYDLFYRISPDGGISWSEEERLTTSETDSVNPHLASDMRYLFLIWEERIGEGAIFFSRFDGNSWSDPIRISPQSSSASDPRIGVMMSRPSPQIFAFWLTKHGGRSVIVYSTSVDDGRSWSFPKAVEESDLPQTSPDASSGITSVYLTWIEGQKDKRVVRFKKLGNPASERVMNITSPGFNSNPRLSVWEPHILLSWQNSSSIDAPSQIMISESPGFGDSWDKPDLLTKGYVESVLPYPILTPRHVWIFWQSGGESGWRIKGVLRKVQERGWTELGILSSGEEAEVDPVAIATPAPEVFQIHLVWVRISGERRSSLLYRRYDTLPPDPPGKPIHFDFTAPEKVDDDEMLSFRWTEEDKTAVLFDLFLSKDGGDFLPVGSTDDRFASIKVESGHIYRLKVRAKDDSGNLSEPSPPSDPIFVDAIPPYVQISLPYPGSRIFGKVQVYVTCRDDNLSKWTLYWGEGKTPTVWHQIFSSREETEENPVEWDVTGLLGLYTLKLEAKDEVGHVSAHTISLEVDNLPPLRIKPGLIERPLPSDPTISYRDPSWSPDGRFVAYSSNESGVWDIWILDIRSGERVNVTSDIAIDKNPSWSPDGKRLVYQSFQNGNWDLWTVELGSDHKVRLTDLPSDEMDPAWSPIGDRIAFASNIDGDFEIYLLPAQGGAIEKVTDDMWDERDPVWHPNGLFLAYRSNRRGEWDIVQRLMASGGKEKELTSTTADETDLSWSHDGKRILFTRSVPEGIKELFSLDLITGAISRVSPQGIEASNGTWAPDGKAVACQSDREILVIHFDFPMPNLEAYITSPYTGDVVSGRVEIFGVARGELFESYLLERSTPDGRWVQVEGIATEPVEEEGFLGMWDTSKLEGEYTLRLTVFGSDGSKAEDSVRVLVRNEPPKLTVIQPADGTIWKKDRIIEVICQADPGSELLVNGSRALQNGSTFIGKAWLVEGWNEIVIRAIDPLNRSVEFKTHVLLDTTPPELEIISPDDFELVKDPFVIVKGKLNEEGQVYVNSIPLPPVQDGEEFSYTVSLEEGTNEITIEASDRAGHSTKVRRRVIYRKPQSILKDESPPVAVDPFPPNGAILSSKEVEISLRLVDNMGLDPETLEVWFDNEKLNEDDYSFREGRLSYHIAEIPDGEHILKLSISDISGNRLEGYTLRFFVDTTPALTAVWAELNRDRLKINTTAIGPIERLSFIKVLQSGLGYGYTVNLDESGKGELHIVPSQRSFRLLGSAFLRDNSIVSVEGYFAYENLSRMNETRISVEMGPELVLPPGDPKVRVILKSQVGDPSLMLFQYDNANLRGLKMIGPVCQISSSRDLSNLSMELSLPLPRNVKKAAIFRWDEKGQTWIPLDAELDLKSRRLRTSLFISGPTSDLGRYALLADETPPSISVISPPDGGEVSPDNFLVIAEVKDEGSGIADVKVEVDGQVKPARFNPKENRLIYLPSDLSEGMHTITITALDRAGNSASSESRFFIGKFFDFVADPIVYPNPSCEEVFIRFALTRSSDVTLRIYTSAGDLLFTDRKTGVAEGVFRWDQRNQAGRKVAPGIYLFSIEARNGEKKLTRRGKLAVLGISVK